MWLFMVNRLGRGVLRCISSRSKPLFLSFESGTDKVSGGRDEHLFIGAVFGSVFLPTQPYTSELEWQFERFATNTGCNGTVDELACLRSTDVATLQLANVPSPYPGQTGSPRWYWTPSIDGVLLTDHVYSSFAKGNFIDVPTIVGSK